MSNDQTDLTDLMPISGRVPRPLWKAFQALARDERRTANAMINYLIEQAVNEHATSNGA
jgi:hypothetical protein